MTFFLVILVLTIIYLAVLVIYWSMLYPLLRRIVAMKISSSHDTLRLEALTGKVSAEGEMYVRVSRFLREAEKCAKRGDYVYVDFVPNTERSERARKIRELREEMDKEHSGLVEYVTWTQRSLVQMYVVQRPFAAIFLAGLALMGYFLERCRAAASQREEEYAAAMLSRA